MTDDREVEPATSVAFERLIADLAAAFVDLPVSAIDAHVTDLIGRVCEFFDLDRSQVAQRSPDTGDFHITHQWLRVNIPRVAPFVPAEAIPWLVKQVNENRSVILSRLDELPPEAARDRAVIAHDHTKSTAILPLSAGGLVLGGVSFGAVRRHRSWPPAVVDRLHLVARIVAGALARKRGDNAARAALTFEQFIADLSATFVNAPAETIDALITDALRRVADVLDLDRMQVAQRVPGGLEVTHQWTRDEDWRVPPFIPGEAIPWVTARASRGEPTIAARMSDLPVGVDREFIERFGTKSVAILPMMVGGRFIGGASFGAIRHERDWRPETVARLRLVVEIIGNALARKVADLELRATLAENERLRRRLERENVYLQEELESAQFGEIVGRSPALRAVLHKVDQVAATDASVLLLGETGTGKELVARAIHARSGRGGRPLITVNCAALPPSLIESELFGHEKGAFTGATHARAGRFEIADGSTLFLDEIGDLDPALQAKLLRALQDGEITRLGASVSRKIDVRIIAATNRDLGRAMDEGWFREDLYYRLSVFPIDVPPLRERREDIPLLVWHFIQSRQRALGREITSIPEPAMEALAAYDWPGNIRELQNVIDRALILSTGSALGLDEAFGRSRTGPSEARRLQAPAVKEPPAAERLADAERAHIESVLRRCGWRIEGAGQAAARLGLRPSTLRNRMRKLGIRRPKPGEG